MDDLEKKNDNIPYLIFSCSKCGQFLYSKLTQKTKKCLKCGKIHTLDVIKRKGEIINGLTNAFEYIKRKQNEIAIEMSGLDPTFQAVNDFSIAGNKEEIYEITPNLNLKRSYDEDFSNNFTLLLQKLSKTYKEFPEYVIELMIDEFKIPISQLRILINSFKLRGILIPLSNNYFKIDL